MVTPMEKLVTLLLAHPERFHWSEIPCCLLGLLELHDEPPPDVHKPDTSKSLHTSHQPERFHAL
jgi:hypothetical protein